MVETTLEMSRKITIRELVRRYMRHQIRYDEFSDELDKLFKIAVDTAR